MTSNIFLLLGSNLGDRLNNLTTARLLIEEKVGKIIHQSSVYRTEAWGKTDQPDFYNQVIQLQSVLLPEDLLASVLTIEKEMGRVRIEKWGTRVIDIDILFYNNSQISTYSLQVPHPEIQNRKFTLLPLDEIASDFIHPAFQKSIHQLLIECPDQLPVVRMIS